VKAKSLAIFAAVSFLFVFVNVAAAQTPKDACDVPKDLEREIAGKYPGRKVVALSDLQEDDRGFFQTDHGSGCPGLVKIDFYGDGKPTLALVLIPKAETNQKAELVVAHQVDATWKITLLATGGLNVPVVWSLPPGTYTDVYGKKTIRATGPVIVFFQYEAWGILYAWTGKTVNKIWIAD
jgi:hypothetical protein